MPKIVFRASGGVAVVLTSRSAVRRSFSGLIDVAFSPHGSRLATAGGDGTARVWDASTGQPQLVLHGHQAPVNSVAFSPDAKLLATGSDDETVRLWDAVTGVEIRTITAHTQRVWQVALVPTARAWRRVEPQGRIKLHCRDHGLLRGIRDLGKFLRAVWRQSS